MRGRRHRPLPQCRPNGAHVADIERLAQLIEPEATALGFDLVRVKMMPSEAGDGGMALQIMAEDPATGQLVIDQCAALSRRVSDVIDAAEEAGEVLIEGAYHLEVSSPGIDRPLTRPKDFVNWAGHEAKIELVEPFLGQKRFRGKLYGIDPHGDAGAVGVYNKDGSISFVPLQQIHSAKLVLTDALIAATRPIDTTGVEDIVETDEEEKADD